MSGEGRELEGEFRDQVYQALVRSGNQDTFYRHLDMGFTEVATAHGPWVDADPEEKPGQQQSRVTTALKFTSPEGSIAGETFRQFRDDTESEIRPPGEDGWHGSTLYGTNERLFLYEAGKAQLEFGGPRDLRVIAEQAGTIFEGITGMPFVRPEPIKKMDWQEAGFDLHVLERLGKEPFVRMLGRGYETVVHAAGPKVPGAGDGEQMDHAYFFTSPTREVTGVHESSSWHDGFEWNYGGSKETEMEPAELAVFKERWKLTKESKPRSLTEVLGIIEGVEARG